MIVPCEISEGGFTSMSSEAQNNEQQSIELAPPFSIMAICTDFSRCGSAVYTDATIQLVADRKDPGDPYKGLDIIIQRINPQVVIVSRVQTKLINFLEKRFKFKVSELGKANYRQVAAITDTHNEDENTEIFDFTLAIVPNIWFSISKGVQKLIESELVERKNFKTDQEKMLFITSKVEQSLDVCAIRAISALDNYIIHEFTKEPDMDITVDTTQNSNHRQSRHSQTQTQTQQTNHNEESRNLVNLMPILEIKYVDPGPVLSMDKFTFESLNIFRHLNIKLIREGVPNAEDEGISSLYEILNQCQSLQGKRQLRTMMLWPLRDINELRHRHEVIDYFLKPDNRLVHSELSMNLRNVVPLSPLLTKFSHTLGNYKDLTVLYKALWSFTVVMDIIKANPGHNLELFYRIVNLDTPDLRCAVDSILNTVDFEQSKKDGRVHVCIGVDNDVDEKKELVESVQAICDEAGIEETTRYKDVIRKICTVMYVPRLGFICSFDYSSAPELAMMRSNKGFDILLFTEKSIYFKTKRMEELDDHAGDIACDLIDVQERVISDLQNEILKHTETILKLMELCGELDCLISFANVTLQRGYTRPEFIDSDEEINIKQAFHPLHSIKSNMIPNDALFYKAASERPVKVMVITGPNASGKTTYMKEVCIIVYMAQIGCFVPASNAKLPIVDAIFTRMHSANSLSTGLSSFATDLHQINYALARATEKSLIAIDEFGKGTQARDGFHLLKGLVIYFASRKLKSPYVMITTHFNRLINHLQSYSEYILYKTLKVTRDAARDTIVYEFKVMEGVGETSLADQVAARAGIPSRIIERADQIRDYITEGRLIQARPAYAA